VAIVRVAVVLETQGVMNGVENKLRSSMKATIHRIVSLSVIITF